MKSFYAILILISFTSCKKVELSDEKISPKPNSSKIQERGLNLLNHPNGQQLTMIYAQQDHLVELLDNIKARGHDTKNMWFRLRGGNSSQKFGVELFPDDLCESWANLQSIYNFKIIFGVNLNDTIEEDIAFYQKLISFGMKIHAIEYGNEQYLKKFTQGPDLMADGTSCDLNHSTGVVTEQTCGITPQKYLDLVTPRITEFDRFKLPHFIQFAPTGNNPNNVEYNVNFYKAWNKIILPYINENSDINLNGILHIYAHVVDEFPYSLIPNLRSQMPSGRKIFVTEYGFRFNEEGPPSDEDSAFVGRKEAQVAAHLDKHLNPDEVAFNHVAYNDYPGGGQVDAWINSFVGITPKGHVMLNALYPQNSGYTPVNENM